MAFYAQIYVSMYIIILLKIDLSTTQLINKKGMLTKTHPTRSDKANKKHTVLSLNVTEIQHLPLEKNIFF